MSDSIKKIASIDFGSNTFLLTIAEIEQVGEKKKIRKVLVDEHTVVQLAKGMSQSRKIESASLQRAKDCLFSYRSIIDSYKVDKVSAVATSAVRDASNQEEFLSLTEQFEIPVRIISGKEEMLLSYRGALADYDNPKGITLVDIGGGSTEIVGLTDSKVAGESLNIGSVRLTDHFNSRQAMSENQLQEMSGFIKNELEASGLAALRDSTEKLLAVAGTPTVLAMMEGGIGFSRDKIDGFKISLNRLEHWCKELALKSLDERKKIPFLPSDRADVIPAGAALLYEICRWFKREEIVVSTKGVRFGLLLEG